ncbi:MAG: hypothetical protein FWD58_10280 [Firmicutes bacterium]|nr:hypothetical protein [Bacillota bacterium]
MVKNLTAAFIYRIFAFLLAVSGLILGSGFGTGVGKWFFYTQQSNILIAGLFLYLAVRTGMDLKKITNYKLQITNADGKQRQAHNAQCTMTDDGDRNPDCPKTPNPEKIDTCGSHGSATLTGDAVTGGYGSARGRVYGDTSAQREVPQRGFGNLLSEIDVPVPPTPPPGTAMAARTTFGGPARASTPTGNNLTNPSDIPNSSLLIPNSPPHPAAIPNSSFLIPNSPRPCPCYCPRFQMAATLMITFTLLVFWCLIAPFAGSHGLRLWTYGNLAVHVFTPLVAIVDYVLFCKRGKLKKRDVFLCLMLPVANLTLASVLGLCGMVYYVDNGVGRHFPYYFMDFYMLGWLAAVFLAGITFVYFLCALAVYRLDRRKHEA